MSPALSRIGVSARSSTVATFFALGVASVASLSTAKAADGATACGARLQGRFVEGAPRDRFELAHRSSAGWTITHLELDLDGSAGQLVFDTEAGGRGVEVFQPFRVEAGSVRASAVSVPADGASRIALEFGAPGPRATDADGFAAGDTFVFSIDVDDRLPASELGQIRVSGTEIEGARLQADFVHASGVTERLGGDFDADARVELVGTPCPD